MSNETSEDDMIAIIITRKTAVGALGALGIIERHGNDPEILHAMNEFMHALVRAKIVTPGHP